MASDRATHEALQLKLSVATTVLRGPLRLTISSCVYAAIAPVLKRGQHLERLRERRRGNERARAAL